MCRILLRPLFQASTPVLQAVKILNLGVLPVQPPIVCYKQAQNTDYSELSHAAYIIDTVHKKRKLNTDERVDRYVSSNCDKTFPAGAILVGAILAEYDFIHQLVHVQTLAVDARYRRMGIGRQLVERVIERANEIQGHHNHSNLNARTMLIELHVHSGNEDAIAFYNSIGFSEYKRIENYYRRLEPQTCIVMRFTHQGDREKK